MNCATPRHELLSIVSTGNSRFCESNENSPQSNKIDAIETGVSVPLEPKENARNSKDKTSTTMSVRFNCVEETKEIPNGIIINRSEQQISETEQPLLVKSSEAEDSPADKQPPGVMSILCLVALKRRLWLLPILTSGWLFSSFWTSYAIAVSYNHTEADFPYISHTAIEAPERCVFGQMVNIGAVMLGMNVILRYLFVKKYLLCRKTPPESRWYKINLAGIVLGFLSALGLSMVANFQTEVQRGPHYVGAALAFGCGSVYCWLQTALTYKIRYCVSRKRVLFAVQLLNSIAMTMLLLLFCTTKTIYKIQDAQGLGSRWGSLRGIYLTSSITEWLIALTVLTFILTYAPDFKNMRLDDPNIYLESNFERKHSSIKLERSDTNCNIKNAVVLNGVTTILPGDGNDVTSDQDGTAKTEGKFDV